MTGSPLQKPAKRGPKPCRPIARSKKPIPRSSRPAKVRRTAGGKAKHAADLAWAKAIRAKGPCVAKGEPFAYRTEWFLETPAGFRRESAITYHAHRCPGTEVEAAHIIRRGYAATRTDLDNGVPLCHSAHAYFTERPEAWIAFAKRTIGSEKYEALRQKAIQGPKPPQGETE